MGETGLPALTWTTFVAGHMAPSAVQTRMVHFSPLACLFLLAPVVVVVVAAHALGAVVCTGASISWRGARLGVGRIVCVRGHRCPLRKRSGGPRLFRRERGKKKKRQVSREVGVRRKRASTTKRQLLPTRLAVSLPNSEFELAAPAHPTDNVSSLFFCSDARSNPASLHVSKRGTIIASTASITQHSSKTLSPLQTLAQHLPSGCLHVAQLYFRRYS
jgi:hypothetical protein